MNKYNWPVIGQKKIVEFLQKNIDNNKLSHAYLFSGQANLGKRLLADNFISTILCHDYHQQKKESVQSLPCNECVFCQQIKKGIHPDFYLLKKEDEKKNISVEQVRQMQKFLQMGSFLNSYKIALIANAEFMSESAQNSLLKVLEEPTKKTILILLSSDADLLLPTIVSRCQLFKFQTSPTQQIFDYLLSLGANRQQADTLSALAHGQIGLAVNYWQNKEAYNEYLNKTKFFLDFFTQDLIFLFKQIEELIKPFKVNQELVSFLHSELDFWQLIIRDLLLVKNNTPNLIVNLKFKNEFEKMATVYSNQKLVNLLSNIKLVKKYLTYNINPRLAVENLILSF